MFSYLIIMRSEVKSLQTCLEMQKLTFYWQSEWLQWMLWNKHHHTDMFAIYQMRDFQVSMCLCISMGSLALTVSSVPVSFQLMNQLEESIIIVMDKRTTRHSVLSTLRMKFKKKTLQNFCIISRLFWEKNRM